MKITSIENNISNSENVCACFVSGAVKSEPVVLKFAERRVIDVIDLDGDCVDGKV